MSDQATEAQTTQADAALQPDTSDATQADGQDENGTPEPEALSVEDARKLRNEARALRDRLKAYEDKHLSEQEKREREFSGLQETNKTLEQELNGLRLQVAAQRAGIQPGLVKFMPRLFDWEQVQDPSDMKQLERAVKQFVKENAEAFGPDVPDTNGGEGHNSRREMPTDMNRLIRRAAGRS